MAITLIGYRGCGKSTVGELLAARLGWEFVDADAVIEQRAGKTIREIFEDSGEPEFRRIERDVMSELLQRAELVIAAGGGAVMDQRTEIAMQDSGPVVWLNADVDTLMERIESDPVSEHRRPNLTSSGGRAEVEQLLQARRPIYDRCSSLSVDANRLSPEEITERILSAVRTPPPAQGGRA